MKKRKVETSRHRNKAKIDKESVILNIKNRSLQEGKGHEEEEGEKKA